MSIKLRLALLLGLMVGGFAIALLMLGRMERLEADESLARERQTRSQLLGHTIDFAHRGLPQFTTELAQAREFAGLLAQADTPATRETILTQLANAGMSSLWVVTESGAPRLHVSVQRGAGTQELPLSPADFTAVVAETPSPRFFAEHAGELQEISIRRLAYSPAVEWLVVARRWDESQLVALSSLTESRVSIRAPHEVMQPSESGSRIVLTRTLSDWRGHPVRVLRFEHLTPEIDRAGWDDASQARVFFAFGLMIIAAMWLFMQAWVLRPLARIGESLATNNPQTVAALSAEKSELGAVAQLVRSSFEQREALEREVRERSIAQAARERSEIALRANLEERSRLGRDLHDGVIQSLYAAGMGLAGIRSLLQPEQVEAASRLEQSRAALNETIHDVRNFLIGLEPEALRLQTFSQAVSALLELMVGIRRFDSHVEIDEGLAGRLSLAQRIHALQIAREAVSNALRHGEANRVSIVLRMQDGRAQFEVADNGRGFEPGVASSPGKGLLNFVERARELGAQLNVDSVPGAGTSVSLIFSLPSS